MTAKRSALIVATTQPRVGVLAACESVTVTYGSGEARVTALDDVTLAVRPGTRRWRPGGRGAYRRRP